MILIHLSETLIAVEVPGEAYNVKIIKALRNAICRVAYNSSDLSFGWVDIPWGKWRIIGTVTADTIDFDCEPYVDYSGKEGNIKYYKLHGTDKFTKNVSESFRSFLNSKDARWVNPYHKPQNCGCYGPCGNPCKWADWMEVEQSLIKGKGVVLKMIK